MEYRQLEAKELSRDLFRHFNRYQKVERCWRKEHGTWILKDIPFEENWNDDNYAFLVKCLKSTITTGGAVFGAFVYNMLVGFSSVENEPFGCRKEYLQLSSLHVSFEHRGRGIGKALFLLSADRARELGAVKLYISAHSSQETQAFYKSMHCVEALEYNQKLVAAEPFDCQLEYPLSSGH